MNGHRHKKQGCFHCCWCNPWTFYIIHNILPHVWSQECSQWCWPDCILANPAPLHKYPATSASEANTCFAIGWCCAPGGLFCLAGRSVIYLTGVNPQGMANWSSDFRDLLPSLNDCRGCQTLGVIMEGLGYPLPYLYVLGMTTRMKLQVFEETLSGLRTLQPPE
jgi:hypothetical protein